MRERSPQRRLHVVFAALFGILGLYFLFNAARGFGLGRVRETT